MAVPFRLPSRVPVSLLCLLGVAGVVPLAGSQETAPPASQAPGQPAPSVRPRMREHFARGAEIRDAVIRADLEAVREPAKWLATHPQEDLPPSAQANIGEMQRVAAEVAGAPDIAHAARGVARLATACGSCHTAVGVTPTLMAARPRREDETLAGHMRKHYRAADLLYRGLVVPSTHSWNSGAEALTGDPVELELQRGSTPDPEIQALAQQLHGLAQQARKAENEKSRTEVYGEMLATCSACHKRQNIVLPHSRNQGNQKN
jgi:mono/diheme cytochrome c family protein